MSEIYSSSVKVRNNMYLDICEKLLKCILYSNTDAMAIGDSINIIKEIINNSDSIKGIIVKNDDKSIEFNNGSKIHIKDNDEVDKVKGNTSNHVYYGDNEYFNNVVKSFNCAKENL